MMFEQIEHPDITAACRTGYPDWYPVDPEPIGECYHCGGDVYEADFDWNGRLICRECKEDEE